MAKITLENILTAFASATSLNQRFDDIEAHLNNKVLYRDNPDGEPNQMLNDLDMNSNRMLNLPNALTNQEPATYGQLIATLASAQGELGSTTLVENQTAIEDKQATYTLVNPYIPGLNNLAIYRNGVRITNTSYTEVDVNTVRIDAPSVNAIQAGDIFTFVVNETSVIPEVGASTVREELTATSNGQTVFNLNVGYVPGVNNLSVYRNGAKIPLSAYVETDANTVTFTASEATSIVTGDEFEFIVNERDVSTATTPASNVTYTPEGTGAVATDVKSYLDKRVLDDVTALRAYEPVVDEEQVFILGHTNKGLGGGKFYYDETDTTTADNGGTVIITAGGKRWKRPQDEALNVAMFGALIDGTTDYSTSVQAAVSALLPFQELNFLGYEYVVTNIAVATQGVILKNGRLIAPLSATESCLVVTVDDVSLLDMGTTVDWANLTASGTVNVGGVHANGANNLRIIGGDYLGARSDSYGTTVSEYRSAINLYRCSNAYIAPRKVGEVGFIDALGLWESYSCEVNGGLYENGNYSGIATATDEGTAPSGDYGKHIIIVPRVRGMGTSSVTINDTRCQVIAPDIDGGLNGVNFGHSSGQPGVVGIVADNSVLIGGTIRNTTAHGVAVGNSKNVRVLGPYIEDTTGSGVRYFDNCDGAYVGAGTKVRRAGDTFIGFSVGDFPGAYTVGDVDLEDCQSHGILMIGGTELKVSNVKVKDVDDANLNRQVIEWQASATTAPERLEIRNVDYEHVNSTSPANRGINVTNSVATLQVDITGNDFRDVAFEKVLFDVAPSSPNISRNRFSTDSMIGFVAFDGASTSQVVSNGNLTQYSVPKITFRDADCHTRQIYVSSFGNGTFTINGATGSNADFSYEV